MVMGMKSGRNGLKLSVYGICLVGERNGSTSTEGMYHYSAIWAMLAMAGEGPTSFPILARAGARSSSPRPASRRAPRAQAGFRLSGFVFIAGAAAGTFGSGRAGTGPAMAGAAGCGRRHGRRVDVGSRGARGGCCRLARQRRQRALLLVLPCGGALHRACGGSQPPRGGDVRLPPVGETRPLTGNVSGDERRRLGARVRNG